MKPDANLDSIRKQTTSKDETAKLRQEYLELRKVLRELERRKNSAQYVSTRNNSSRLEPR